MSLNQLLKTRFHQEVQKTFYPYFILSILDKNGLTSSTALLTDLQKLTDGQLSLNETSHFYLLSRLEKTFKLIEAEDPKKKIQERSYSLTAEGLDLLKESNITTIKALKNALGQ